MIRPLRRAHRAITIGLLLLLPVLLALAVAYRPASPVQNPWTIGEAP